MTIQEAVELVDRLKPNQYEHEQKVKWLSKIDGMIFTEILSTHENSPIEEFNGYNSSEPEQPLLVPYPYDEDIYNYFLQMQIDRENGEMAKYNQSATMFNSSYKTFGDYYNRTHRPLPGESQFLF